jgi:hypothetical protein
MRHVYRHAVQQEIVMLTCPGPEVFSLYFAQDIYKLIPEPAARSAVRGY